MIGFTQKGEKFYIDRTDYETVKDLCWRKDVDGYIVSTVNRKSLYLHRYLMNAEDGMVVDHINHDIADNRRTNLRVVLQVKICKTQLSALEIRQQYQVLTGMKKCISGMQESISISKRLSLVTILTFLMRWQRVKPVKKIIVVNTVTTTVWLHPM